MLHKVIVRDALFESTMALRISKRSQLKFAEYATAWSTINGISRVFEAEGFSAGPKQPDVGGARRSTCASYHNQIDPMSTRQQRRLLNVYLDAPSTWRGEDRRVPGLGLDLVKSLRLDGIPIDDDGQLTAPVRSDDSLKLEDFRLLRDPTVLEEYLDRMEANIDSDTPAVIGAAKELIEAVCKMILDDAGVGYGNAEPLPDLYKSVASELKLSRESVPASAKGSEAAQRVLQGLVTVVQNLAELRNALGLGHGRSRKVPALERHARLAMNASRTVTDFLLTTWHHRRG